MTDKERLENMSPIGFDLNGDVLLRNEDYHWLMEQAERVEKLETQLSINTNNMKHLQNKIERYKQALEDISKVGWTDRFGGGFSYTGENHAECVKIAKQALEGNDDE